MLNDELWAKLSAILQQNGLYAKQSTRLNIEGLLYRMRTGCPWRDLPVDPEGTVQAGGLRMGVHGWQ